jgi:lisH domain-containing protein FOPNL
VQSGALPKMQAQVRAQIVNALDDSSSNRPPVQPSSETYLINELIREYLEFQGYRAAASVFVPECGLSQTSRLGRDCLAERLRVREGPNTKALPLLYALAARPEQGRG